MSAHSRGPSTATGPARPARQAQEEGGPRPRSTRRMRPRGDRTPDGSTGAARDGAESEPRHNRPPPPRPPKDVRRPPNGWPQPPRARGPGMTTGYGARPSAWRGRSRGRPGRSRRAQYQMAPGAAATLSTHCLRRGDRCAGLGRRARPRPTARRRRQRGRRRRSRPGSAAGRPRHLTESRRPRPREAGGGGRRGTAPTAEAPGKQGERQESTEPAHDRTTGECSNSVPEAQRE